jgi:gas vesicle protein
MNSSSKVILALLGGVAIGAALGILFAPEKGSETRQKIADKAKEFGEKTKQKFSEGIRNAKHKKEQAESEVGEFI